MLIHELNSDHILQLQNSQGSLYWSKCAELVCNKHGLRCAEAKGSYEPKNTTNNYNISLRGTANLEHHGFFEGPIEKQLLNNIGICFETETCAEIEIFDKYKKSVGKLNYKRFNVKKIPQSRKETTIPYEHIDKNEMLRAKTISFQYFDKISKNWEIVAFAKTEGGELKPILVKNSKHMMCGFEVFDIFGFNHFLPKLTHGFFNTFEGTYQFLVERFFIEEIQKHSYDINMSVTRNPIWPRAYKAALSIRHDYDRFIVDEKVDEILHFYSKNELKSTWFILVDRPPSQYQINSILALGHEVSLHTVASTFSEFESEVKKFRELTGVKAEGFTCHGGIGSSGALGLTHNVWARKCGLRYGEMHGSCRGMPHPLIAVANNEMIVEDFFVQNCHFSLDINTRKDGHQLEKLAKEIPIALENGEHVTIMNHPDIHWEELKLLLGRLNLDSVLKESIHKVLMSVGNGYHV